MHFKTIGIIGRYQDTGLDAPLQALATMLTAAGCQVLLEYDTAQNTGILGYQAMPMEALAQNIDLAVVMGGDGTMLATARQLAASGVPLVGINHGRVGFITDIPIHNATEALARVLEGDFTYEDRALLEGRIVREDQTLFSGVALNDVVVNRAGRGGMIDVRVELDGLFMMSQRADGLIVSTPTGSTAYSLSAHGPIVHPQLSAMLLVPVAPQTLSNRPIVLPDSGTLSLTIMALGRVETGASVHFDMQTWSDCQVGDRIDVRRAQDTVRLLHPAGYSFFSTLRRKLSWNRLPQHCDETE